MAAPTFVQESESAWNSNTTPKNTSPAFNTSIADVLASMGAGEDGAVTAITPSLTGESFTAQELQGTTGANCRLDARTGIIGSAGAAEVVSIARTGSVSHYGANVLVFSGSDGVGAAESAAIAAGSSAPNLAITTTQANSAIVVIVTDWNATDPATWTWRQIGGVDPTQVTAHFDSTRYSVRVGYFADAGAIGAKAVGVTNSLRYTIAAIEVKGTAGGAAPASLLVPRRAHRGLLMRTR